VKEVAAIIDETPISALRDDNQWHRFAESFACLPEITLATENLGFFCVNEEDVKARQQREKAIPVLPNLMEDCGQANQAVAATHVRNQSAEHVWRQNAQVHCTALRYLSPIGLD
jgi:hypothetical protein